MPADIRSFFGGKPAPGPAAKSPAKKEDSSSTRKKRSRKVVDDSDDEEEPEITKPSPRKAKAKNDVKPKASQGEPTSTSDYFASSKKKPRQTPANGASTSEELKSRNAAVEIKVNKHESPKKSTAAASQKKPAGKLAKVIEEEKLGYDDIFATEYSKPGKADDDYVEVGDDDSESGFEELPVKPAKAPARKSGRKGRDDDEDVVSEDAPKPSAAKPGRKRKSEAIADMDENEDDDYKAAPKKIVARTKATASTQAAKKPRGPPKDDKPESKELQEIFDSIPTVRPPTPPPPTDEAKKFNFAAVRSRTPPGGGSKEMPVGAENCLAGLTFVFTGVLDTLGREEGQNLVKRYGGKVTTAPSTKTSYVVLGSDAGPNKLKKIRDNNIKTINEDGLFELIRRLPANGGDGKAAAQHEAKKKADEEKVRAMAAEIDREEKQRRQPTNGPSSKLAAAPSRTPSSSQTSTVDDRLWTTKYAPTSINMICGNKGAVEKLHTWLRDWHRNAKANFKKAGKDGTGIYRAVMIHGPPGIGKTTAAHLVAKLEGYDVIETNASNTRSKKLVETGLLGVLDTTSLQGYFAGAGKKVESEKKNIVLIMDEVDGMSAGDRGGVGALAAIAKKTHVPLILICNERRQPKMKPFDGVVYEMPFRRPTAEQIRARLSTICFREGLRIPPHVLDSLIEGTHADIRQVINMLSTVKLDQQQLDFDRGKEMSKAWEKHVILKPWDIVSKILNAQTFAPSSKMTLNDKIELYFNDHEFSSLMLQENYLITSPVLAGNYHGKERALKMLELVDNAASSISDGDLVDRMIHGTQQQWSLMPTHAAFSFVRPASFVYGNMINRPGFTSWLGQNSKQGKLWRFVKEIQGHMRLRSSGDRDEIRQQYIPLLWERLIRKLMEEGKEAVDDVIELMDSYFLTREDFDALIDLGLGPMDASNVKIESQTKATFTRVYNQRSHPLPFMKASGVVATAKAPKVKPDIEDAIDESDEEGIPEDDAKLVDESEELDLKKDKYVSVPKKTATSKAGTAKGKKSKKAAAADEDDFIEEDEKPKKGRGRKPKAKT